MYTINCGMDYKEAGPLGLAGGAKSHRTELPEDIKTFERFQVLCITKKLAYAVICMYIQCQCNNTLLINQCNNTSCC